MTLKLHVFPLSPRAFKVLLAAHHLGVDYELCMVDLPKSEHKTPAFGALNPNMRMPVLEEDGFVLWESNAIVEYLASKALGWLPGDTRARLAITKWLYWESNHWDPACSVFVFERIVKPFFGMGEPAASEIARGEISFKRLAGVLNEEFGKRRYVAGDSLTIADLAVGASLVASEQAGYPLEEFRAVQRWQAELAALPAWKQTLALQEPRT
ncbi:MAG TPA: glutathione S-transferase family protein [Rhizomicrobium sp.]|jgi:glutathione S-transferase